MLYTCTFLEYIQCCLLVCEVLWSLFTQTTGNISGDDEDYQDTVETISSSNEDEEEEDEAGDVIEEMFISDESDSPATKAMKEPLSQCQKSLWPKLCTVQTTEIGLETSSKKNEWMQGWRL